MSDWKAADELDVKRNDIYGRLKEALAVRAGERDLRKLEEELQDAMRDHAEEIERVLKGAGIAAPTPHDFKATGGTIPNAYDGTVIGTIYACTRCKGRIIIWPDGRSQPVSRPFPVNCT
jgi:hypothetical protein